MECPCCGKDCLMAAEEVLAGLDSRYMACPDCAPDPGIDKSLPLKSLPERIDRCIKCRRAPLDAVMLDALRIMRETGVRDDKDSLKNVGSPLISIGYPLTYPPRLGPRSLIIMGERIGREAAEEIHRRVPEIKGLIQVSGLPGVKGDSSGPNEGLLLAGCDLRCDVISGLFGDLVIYKSQSKIHIEFPRRGAPKIRILEKLFLGGRVEEVVDGLCGPGTLGLMCVLGGAKRVVLNDIWLPAVENVMMNLVANKNLLGLDKIERVEKPAKALGAEPVLVGRASGSCEIEVYHGDLSRLFESAKPAGLCLIDPFPGADYGDLEKACGCCKKVVII